MKCHEPGCRRRPRPLRHVSWNVMRCHVRHARGAYSSACSGMSSSFRAAAPDIPSGSDICLSSAQVLSPGPVSLLPPACGGVPVSRVSRGCARGAAGGRIAAARLARLIARARRRTHLARPFPPGSFSRPPAIAFCRNAERRPRKPPLSTFILHHIAKCQARPGTKKENSRCFSRSPLNRRDNRSFFSSRSAVPYRRSRPGTHRKGYGSESSPPTVAPASARGLPDSHISSLLASSTLAGPVTARSAPSFVAPAPEPGSMSSSRTRSGTLVPDAAAAGGEQTQPPKLPRGPRLGPGSGSGATVGGVRCEVTGPRCVHAVGFPARGRDRRGPGRRLGRNLAMSLKSILPVSPGIPDRVGVRRQHEGDVVAPFGVRHLQAHDDFAHEAGTVRRRRHGREIGPDSSTIS